MACFFDWLLVPGESLGSLGHTGCPEWHGNVPKRGSEGPKRLFPTACNSKPGVKHSPSTYHLTAPWEKHGPHDQLGRTAAASQQPQRFGRAAGRSLTPHTAQPLAAEPPHPATRVTHASAGASARRQGFDGADSLRSDSPAPTRRICVAFSRISWLSACGPTFELAMLCVE